VVQQAMIGSRQAFRGLRPMNPGRDLGELADLIEVAFAEDLAASGRSTADEIRSLQWMGPVAGILSAASGLFRDLFTGYVWVEEGRIVGNVTITRAQNDLHEWIISNLAVYPEYRRRGIARRLMEAALEYILDRDSAWISLQVRSDNAEAKNLYASLGFRVLDTFAEMHAQRLLNPVPVSQSAYEVVAPVHGRRHALFALERKVLPLALQEMRPLVEEDSHALWAPDRSTRLGELLRGGVSRRRWVLYDEQPVGAVHLKMSLLGEPHRVTFLVHPLHRGQIEHLLAETLVRLEGNLLRHPLSANVSAECPRLNEALRESGFKQVRELDLMGLPLQQEITGPA